jgi:hypothetical protein
MYHMNNVLKLRVMNSLYINDSLRGSKKSMTCKEISELTGIPSEYISRLMSRLRKKGAKYFIRLKPKEGREYRYQLSKIGINWYMIYLNRFYLGYELNCVRSTAQTMPHYEAGKKINVKELANEPLNTNILKKYYLGLTRAGEEMLKKRIAEKATM